jgi:hypothetical protein
LNHQLRSTFFGGKVSIRYTDGSETSIWFDQGMSYWSLARSLQRSPISTFAMDRNDDEIAESIAEIRVSIEGHELPTQVFVDLQNLN